MKKIFPIIRFITAIVLITVMLTLSLNAYVSFNDTSWHQYSITVSAYPGYGGSIVGLKCHLNIDDYYISAQGEYDWYYINPNNVSLCNLLIIQTSVRAIAEFENGLPQTTYIVNNFTGSDLPRYTSNVSFQTDPEIISGTSKITTKLIDVSTHNVIVNNTKIHTCSNS